MEENKEKPAPTESSENSQTPSTPRFSFMIFITSHTHFLFVTVLITKAELIKECTVFNLRKLANKHEYGFGT